MLKKKSSFCIFCLVWQGGGGAGAGGAGDDGGGGTWGLVSAAPRSAPHPNPAASYSEKM